MNPFDRNLLLFMNSFARRSWTLDWLAFLFDSNDLAKGGVVVALLTWVWFRRDALTAERRARLIAGLVATCAAVLFARALSFAFPFRGRPIYNPVLHFVPPYSVEGMNLTGWWTSFPSDNAVLFFALATCVYSASRRAGYLAFFHAILTVALARVYLGYHHPTDILAGAAIGIGVVSLAQIPMLRAALTRIPMRWLDTKPELFYPALFALLFCISAVFDPVFSLGHIVREMGKGERTTIHATSSHHTRGPDRSGQGATATIVLPTTFNADRHRAGAAAQAQ
jgi:undecaprenyl-diphosphatase